jgi:hypothetical protein
MRRPIKVVNLGERAAGVVNDDRAMTCYTIYDHPSDYPDHFVVRAWAILPGLSEPQPTQEHYLAESLDEARSKIPPDRVCFQREDGDDPNIVETWL